MADEDILWRGFESRLERLEDTVKELDELLRGSRKNKISGLITDSERMDDTLRKLNAVVFVDSTGKRGIAHDVDYLMDRRSGAERREGFKWTFWGLILATAISSLTALLTNLDKLKVILPAYRLDPLDQMIEKAKHPKSPKKIYRYRSVPAKVQSNESDQSPPSQ